MKLSKSAGRYMAKEFLNLSTEDFNDIFPFYILMDEKLCITATGDSLQKIVPELNNTFFEDSFSIKRPFITDLNFEALTSYKNQLIIFESKAVDRITFRSQLKFIPEKNQIVLLASPWFENVNELIATGLQFKDFAAHNPIIDFLHILKTQDIANEDMKQVLQKLNRKKSEMLVAQQKLEQISTALEESNKRYEYVNKATSEAIWDWDILSGKVYYGDGFGKLFGYDTKSLPQNFNIWERRIHPDDFERITNDISNFLQSESTNWNDDYRYLKSDGNYAYVSDKGFIIRDEAGNALRMIGSMQDITKQKEEELYLKLMEAVIKNTNDSVVITEIKNDYPIVYVNNAFTKLSGYTFEEVKGKNPRILQGPKSNLEELHKLRDSLKKWQTCEVTTVNYKKNGEEYWVQFSISPISNEKGEYTHWISIERDVTQAIKTNEEIINQKKFTEDILNNIPTDIAVFDPDHNYIFVNQHAIKDKNIRDWMIQKNDFDYARMKGIDDSIAKMRWDMFDQSIYNKTNTEWVDEHNNTNGDSLYKLRIFSPYFENNKLKYVIGYGVDITEIKKAELKIKEAIESIKQSNSELEQFAYVASHDLQEPLRMVTSFLSQLDKKYSQSLDEKAKEYIYYAVDGAKRMRQIILDLLEYSRVGKNSDRITSFNLNEIINEIKILYGKQIEELGASIINEDLPVIIGYKSPIRQLFQNIISNALKYHRQDVAPQINITVKKLNKEWEFSISDNGIGIEEQYFSKIFEIFQRLHNKDEYSGTGIGLAITRKIIDNIGGKIWLTSVHGEGTEFHFTIPFQQNLLF
jgi:PAS domain S-box-containing protein